LAEFRTLCQEIRASGQGDGLTFSGHAAVFNTLSESLGCFRERIAAGAFGKSLQMDDIRALLNHDPNHVLGRNRSNTLDLREDDHGLWFEVRAPDVEWVRALRVSVERGDINQCSFGFECLRDEWRTVDGQEERTLLEVRLFDISLVTYPAYTATDAQVRSAADVFAARTRARGPSLDVVRRRLDLIEKEW